MDKCKICLKTTDNIEIHHIIPKSRGGSDDDRNLIRLCTKCHGLAHNVSFSDNRGKGLINEGVTRIKEQDKIALEWLHDNQNLVEEKMTDLYNHDPDMHMLMLMLMNKHRFRATHIKQWYEFGKVTLKTMITFK